MSRGAAQKRRGPSLRSGRRLRCAVGFTLLEILVALAVTAIAFAALLGLRNRDLDLYARARDVTTATALAQARLGDLELEGVGALGETEGTFEEAPGFVWRVEVASTMFPTVREVRVRVGREAGRPDDAVELLAYFLETSGSPPR